MSLEKQTVSLDNKMFVGFSSDTVGLSSDTAGISVSWLKMPTVSLGKSVVSLEK